MRIFTIDRGNSNTTILKWLGDQFEPVTSISDFNVPAIASNVSSNPFESKILEFNQLDQIKKLLPFEVEYTNTIGVDRLFCAVSASLIKRPEQNALIIDAGTFTTVDVLLGKKFKGGMILPGNESLKKCYTNGANLFTSDLKKDQTITYPFQSTNDCITNSLPFLFESTYEKIIREFSIDHIFLTGGNQKSHSDLLSRNKHMVKIHPYLIHYGIKYIFNKYQHQSRGRQ